MNTPWGESQTETIILPGVVDVTTASHGGLMILWSVAAQHLTPEAIELGDSFGGCLAYEEDCLYNVPLYEWRELRQALEKHNGGKAIDREECRDSIAHWYPEYFEKRFGIIIGNCPQCGKRNRTWCDCEYDVMWREQDASR